MPYPVSPWHVITLESRELNYRSVGCTFQRDGSIWWRPNSERYDPWLMALRTCLDGKQMRPVIHKGVGPGAPRWFFRTPLPGIPVVRLLDIGWALHAQEVQRGRKRITKTELLRRVLALSPEQLEAELAILVLERDRDDFG